MLRYISAPVIWVVVGGLMKRYAAELEGVAKRQHQPTYEEFLFNFDHNDVVNDNIHVFPDYAWRAARSIASLPSTAQRETRIFGLFSDYKRLLARCDVLATALMEADATRRVQYPTAALRMQRSTQYHTLCARISFYRRQILEVRESARQQYDIVMLTMICADRSADSSHATLLSPPVSNSVALRASLPDFNIEM
jgi:hypothetical protein